MEQASHSGRILKRAAALLLACVAGPALLLGPVPGNTSGLESGRDGPALYLPFEDSLANGLSSLPMADDSPYRFPAGIAGKGLALDFQSADRLPALPVTNRFPYRRGTLSLWIRPAANGTAAETVHLLSVSSPGRFYLVRKPDGIFPLVAFARQGVFSDHWLNDLVYHDHFGGPYPRLEWNPAHWYHFVWTWDENESVTYIDGVRVASGRGIPAGAGTDNYFGRTMQIGGYAAKDYLMEDTLDELAAWNRRLDDDEVGRLHALGRQHLPVLEHPAREPADTAAVPRDASANLFENGSFEAGLPGGLYAENPAFAPPGFSPQLFAITDSVAYHGRRSLRITLPAVTATTAFDMAGNYGRAGYCTLASARIRIAPGSGYRVTARLRTGDSIRARLAAALPGTPAPDGIVGETTATLRTGEWIALRTDTLRGAGSDGSVVLRLELENLAPGKAATVYLDGLELTGDAAPGDRYRPARALAGTLATAVPGNIFIAGRDAPDITATLAGTTDAALASTATFRILDMDGHVVRNETVDVTLEPYAGRTLRFSHPASRYGVFRAELLTGGDMQPADSLAYSVLPDRPAQSAIGIHAFPDEYSLGMARRLGFRWLRLWDTGRVLQWNHLQPAPGAAFDWDATDRYIARIREHGFEILPVLYHVSAWTPDPSTGRPPHWIYRDLGGSNAGRALLGNRPLFQAWLDYVSRVAARYRRDIHYWEVMNEPYSEHFGAWTPHEYLALLGATARAIRTGNPSASVVGPVAYAGGDWLEALGELGLSEHIDVFSFHGYGLDHHMIRRLQQLAGPGANTLPVFDTENAGTLSAGDRPAVRAQLDTPGNPAAVSIATHAQLLVMEQAAGVDRVFLYWMRPYPPWSVHASLLSHDGTPDPGLVAFVSVAGTLDGYRAYRTVALDDYVTAFIFKQPATGTGLAALFDRRPAADDPHTAITVSGPEQLTLSDVFGNPIGTGEDPVPGRIRIGAQPVFIRADSPDRLIASLRPADDAGHHRTEVHRH